MKTPKKIYLVIGLIFVIGFTVSINLIGLGIYMEEAKLIISTITLIVWILYVYFTYLIAKEAWTPAASFSFRQFETDPFHIQFIITNHSKFALKAWGKLVAIIDRKEVIPKGFYGKEHPWILQPLQTGYGHFEMKDLASRADKTLSQLAKTNPMLKFSFVLEYEVKQTGEKKTEGPDNYCFNFKEKILFLDV